MYKLSLAELFKCTLLARRSQSDGALEVILVCRNFMNEIGCTSKHTIRGIFFTIFCEPANKTFYATMTSSKITMLSVHLHPPSRSRKETSRFPCCHTSPHARFLPRIFHCTTFSTQIHMVPHALVQRVSVSFVFALPELLCTSLHLLIVVYDISLWSLRDRIASNKICSVVRDLCRNYDYIDDRHDISIRREYRTEKVSRFNRPGNFSHWSATQQIFGNLIAQA